MKLTMQLPKNTVVKPMTKTLPIPVGAVIAIKEQI